MTNDQIQITNDHIAAAGHVTEVYGPVQALQHYLAGRKGTATFITLPFTFSSIPAAEVTEYAGGREAGRAPGHARRGPAVVQYLRDVLFVLRVLARGRKAALFVGIGALNAFAGVLARRRGSVERTAYYVIDYTRKRFANPLLNWAYHWVDRYCVKHSDKVWNLSERMAELRRNQGVEERRNMVVPVGVEVGETRELPREKVDRHRLVLVSHLTPSKGVQLAIEAMEEIAAAEPRARLQVIGTGPYEPVLREQAASLVERGLVEFAGARGHDYLFDYLPSCGVALAPYVQEEGNISYFADPTKPKEYLACSLPVVITRVPWTAEFIDREGMGVAIDYDKGQLAAACLRLMRDDGFYWSARKKARQYALTLDWQVIYDRAIRETMG